MNFIKNIEEFSIPLDCNGTYNSMAFDGCHYYFLIRCLRKIIKTDKCYRRIDCFETCREYDCICYDFRECCFWASSRNCYNKIYKLNFSFKEIDCITICKCTESKGSITGISYDCCCDTLLVAFSTCVVEVYKKCNEPVLKHKSCSLYITGICSVCPYYIITAIKNSKQIVMLLNSENNVLYTKNISCEYIIKTIIFNPCDPCCKSYRFDVLTNKKGIYPYILQVHVDPCSSIFHPCSCNDYVCNHCCVKTPCNPSETCTDVIKSIALVESAISHILNAEGEKLQRILTTTSDVDEILCVNKEINKTIINATHLEHTLYQKLSTVLDCCSYDCPCSCSCCDDSNICICDVDGGHI